MRSYLIIKSIENYPKQVLRFIENNVEVILLTYQYINNEPFGCFLTWWYGVISFCGCHQYNKCTPGVSPWPPLSYFMSPAYLYLYLYLYLKLYLLLLLYLYQPVVQHLSNFPPAALPLFPLSPHFPPCPLEKY